MNYQSKVNKMQKLKLFLKEHIFNLIIFLVFGLPIFSSCVDNPFDYSKHKNHKDSTSHGHKDSLVKDTIVIKKDTVLKDTIEIKKDTVVKDTIEIKKDTVSKDTVYHSHYYIPTDSTTYLSYEEMFITMNKVVSDSRCPYGVECISEGNAEIMITFEEKNGKKETILLNSDTKPNSFRTSKFEYTIDKLLPHPYKKMDGSIYKIKTNEYKLYLLTKEIK